MEATTQVKLKSLEPYRHLFPAAKVVDQTVKMGAGVSDTVSFIPKVVQQCRWQAKAFVDQELRGLSLYNACEKLWYFVKYHIKYEKDKRGKEQVRSVRRLIHDAKGDCDCFTTFIDTCLAEYGVKGIVNRITKYGKDFFQHIYPLVPIGNGKYIVMDCVVDRFNYEEPYTEKEDHKMDLQFLDGIERTKPAKLGIDAQSFNSSMGGEIGELGKLLKNRAAKSGGGGGGKKKGLFKKPLFHKKTPQQKAAKKEQRKEHRKQIVKKTLKAVNKVNKVNPATALLRAGILASMKLNVMNVAGRLKWAYASKELAQSKGMDMSKYDKLKNVLAKTEQIFYAAGGKPENLKKSILTGKGNHNHEVAGLGDYTPLPELLGGIYSDELVYGMEGFEGFGSLGELGELGEPTTAASIAAASTAMGTLAALLKSIGDLFPKRNKEGKEKKERKGIFKRKNADQSQDNQSDAGGDGGDDGQNQSEQNDDEQSQDEQSDSGGGDENSGSDTETSSDEQTDSSQDEQEQSSDENESQDNLPATNEDPDSTELTVNDDGGDQNPEPSDSDESTDGLSGTGIREFWDKNKKWLVPVGLGTVVLGSVLIYASSQKDEGSAPKKSRPPALNGIPKSKKKKGKKKKGGKKQGQVKKSLIALM